MERYLKGWAEFMVAQRGRRPSSVKTHAGTLKEFFVFLEQEARPTDPLQIRRGDIDAYMRSLFFDRGNIKNTTRAKKLAAIKSLFNYLIYIGIIINDPCDGIPTPKIQPRQAQKFSTEELQRLFSAPDITTPKGMRDIAILKTIYGAGLRVHELCGLSFNDIIDSAGCIRLIIHGKGDKDRMVTLRRNPTAALHKWLALREGLNLADSDAVFVQVKEPFNRLLIGAIQQIMAGYSRAIGMSPGTANLHKLRATFATDLYDSGRDRCPRCGYPHEKVDVLEIMTLMGHTDPKTTMRYIAISEKVIKKTAIPDRRWKELEAFDRTQYDKREIFRPKHGI